jgi:hypothetical protein
MIQVDVCVLCKIAYNGCMYVCVDFAHNTVHCYCKKNCKLFKLCIFFLELEHVGEKIWKCFTNYNIVFASENTTTVSRFLEKQNDERFSPDNLVNFGNCANDWFSHVENKSYQTKHLWCWVVNSTEIIYPCLILLCTCTCIASSANITMKVCNLLWVASCLRTKDGTCLPACLICHYYGNVQLYYMHIKNKRIFHRTEQTTKHHGVSNKEILAFFFTVILADGIYHVMKDLMRMPVLLCNMQDDFCLCSLSLSSFISWIRLTCGKDLYTIKVVLHILLFLYFFFPL